MSRPGLAPNKPGRFAADGVEDFANAEVRNGLSWIKSWMSGLCSSPARPGVCPNPRAKLRCGRDHDKTEQARVGALEDVGSQCDLEQVGDSPSPRNSAFHPTSRRPSLLSVTTKASSAEVDSRASGLSVSSHGLPPWNPATMLSRSSNLPGEALTARYHRSGGTCSTSAAPVTSRHCAPPRPETLVAGATAASEVIGVVRPLVRTSVAIVADRDGARRAPTLATSEVNCDRAEIVGPSQPRRAGSDLTEGEQSDLERARAHAGVPSGARTAPSQSLSVARTPALMP